MPEMADGGTSYEVQDLKIDCGSANVSLKGEDKWTHEERHVGADVVLFAVVADGHGGAALEADPVLRNATRFVPNSPLVGVDLLAG